MKFSIFIILLCTSLFANNYYNKEKGKIDMHGGKGDKLLENSPHFSNQKDLNSLKDLSIKQPKKIENLEDLKIKEIDKKKD
ncbi:hypothetical protein CRV01_04615 [Arcobacter sp. CECT 8983]|uniref:hypothetical protein n=1 Tax=Arcobacter sp. CECT 8983 TaxID=2044508 RepID=UPI00100BB9DA|nr:hypothetical protein [Arcobacter sp. CECT 8983]RXJ90446.1 hypothetical protein CRV01_04615 [Arcobacter sp. CECT 8983]